MGVTKCRLISSASKEVNIVAAMGGPWDLYTKTINQIRAGPFAGQTMYPPNQNNWILGCRLIPFE